jgi:factor associated with neutral sphingomyelinase activation
MINDLILKQTSLTTETNFSIEKYTKLWIEGGISNYDYIILLNSAANRTRNDMSQYPVFPWIISNYTSNNLDLTDEKNFRDLSKPIGAINPERLNNLKERFRDMPEPKFLYGTHYSNPAYVIGYLVRKHPEFMLKLHSGKFDHPDRLFFSIKIDWDVCNTLSVKELIPEFYEGDTEFLMNEKKIEFGLNSQGEKIDNVILPPWAVNQNDFLEKMR